MLQQIYKNMEPVTKQQKKDERILTNFEKMTAYGIPKMLAYSRLAGKYKMSVSGIRIAIQRARAHRYTPGPYYEE